MQWNDPSASCVCTHMIASMPRVDIEDLHLRKACTGDSAAFTALIRNYDHQLRGYAYQILRDRTLMDDALQNAYLSAFKAIGSFKGHASFRSWMYRIVHNACIDLIRKRRDERELFESAAIAAGPETGATDRLDLAQAFGRMSPDHRAVLLLVDVEGFDYGAAGEILGVPVGTVRSRLNRARAAMRNELGGDFR